MPLQGTSGYEPLLTFTLPQGTALRVRQPKNELRAPAMRRGEVASASVDSPGDSFENRSLDVDGTHRIVLGGWSEEQCQAA